MAHEIVKRSIASAAGALCLALVPAVLPTVMLPEDANALPLSNAAAVRPGFNFPNGPVADSSYDAPIFETFKPFSGVTDPTLLTLGSFGGLTGGSNLEVFLLSESAYYDGRDPNRANNFGVLNSNGEFISILDSADVDPGDAGSVFQSEADSLTFALQSPEALFSSVDEDNADGLAHILAQQVTKDGTVELDPVNLNGDGPLSFQLFAGDLILYIEDLLNEGNAFLDLGTGLGDFDYNDMVLLVRQTEVPEPASLLLLAGGLPLLRRMRRKQ